MSRAEQLTRVARVVGTVRLTAALRAIGLPRATWYRHQRRRAYADRYGYLREALEQIARTHPEYGYRRVAVELQRTWGQPVNTKVVRRLHRVWDLPLLRVARRPRPSGIQRVITTAGRLANLVERTSVIPIFAVTYTDFSQLVFAGGRNIACLIVLVDHASKVVLGWAVGAQKTTPVALRAWRRARQFLRRRQVAVTGLIVHHDQDPVFLSYRWTSTLLDAHARVSYSLRGPRDNPEMEAFFSRFKTENRSLLLDAPTLAALQALVAVRIQYYNRERRHSRIGYVAPETFVDQSQARP
jgi:putative transposase